MKVNVWARRKARRAMLQAVYQWQVAQPDLANLEAQYLSNGSLEKADVDFFRSCLRGVYHHSDELDAVLEPLLDRTLKELDQIELAVLRLGVYELKERMDVPYRVVIDEYVALAKTFGAEDGHKYVNGVLDRLASSLRPLEARASGES